MRKDILESITEHLMTGIKPNFADIARRYNCDYRTVKRYYDLGKKRPLKKLQNEGSHRHLLRTINQSLKINSSLAALCAQFTTSSN